MITTKLSTIELKGDDTVQMQLHGRAILDAEGMAEALKACQELKQDAALRVLIELPVDADFNMSFMKRDHFKEAGLHMRAAALAIATANPFLERLMGLYFAYYPQPFALRICNSRSEALAWLQEAEEDLRRGVA